MTDRQRSTRNRSFATIVALAIAALAGPASTASIYPVPPPDFTTVNPSLKPLFTTTAGATDRPLLVVLVTYADTPTPAGIDEALAQGVFFGNSFPSVSDYFIDNSRGANLELLPAAETSGVPNNGVVSVVWPTYASWVAGGPEQEVANALTAADAFVDFAAFDSNADGTLTNLELSVAAYRLSVPQDRDGDGTAEDPENCGATRSPRNAPSPLFSLDGKSIGFTGSIVGTNTNLITIVHEVAHQVVDLLDMYDQGVGSFALGGPTCSTIAPLFIPSSFERFKWGWITPTVVTSDQYVTVFPDQAYILYDPDKGTEDYFIAEWRKPTPGTYDQSSPDKGLVIWRVDEGLGIDNGGDERVRFLELIRPDGTRTPGCVDEDVDGLVDEDWCDPLGPSNCGGGPCDCAVDEDLDGTLNEDGPDPGGTVCYGGSTTDAWNPLDSLTPQRTMNTSWYDGSPAAVAVRAIGPALPGSIRAFLDVRGPGVLVDTLNLGAPGVGNLAVTGCQANPVSFPVMNTDDAGEPADDFEFTITPAYGWTVAPDVQTLAPQSAGTANVALTPGPLVTPGVHTLSIIGRSLSDPSITSSCSVPASLADGDHDGVTDGCDNCPYTSNPSQANNDGDLSGDACDPDDDNDTLADPFDNCPFTANLDQADGDGDGIGDVCDNCPSTPNPPPGDTNGDGTVNAGDAQEDLDADGSGDACDLCTDTDADGFGDPGFPANVCADDNCPYTDNPDQMDRDDDGLGDACDACPLLVNDEYTNEDGDADGLGDRCDPFPACPRECQVAPGAAPPGVCAACPGGTPGSGSPRDCAGPGFGGGFGNIGFCLSSIPKPPSALGFCPPILQLVDACCPGGLTCAGPEVDRLTPDGLTDLVVLAGQLGLNGTESFGFSSTILPDIDTDGVADMAVGSPTADPLGLVDAGSVMLISGKFGTPILTIPGEAAGDAFGFAVARHPDGILVGAPLHLPAVAQAPGSPTQAPEGRAYLFGFDGKIISVYDGFAGGEEMGASLAAIGDVDGDGKDDVAVGSPGAGANGNPSGGVGVFSRGGQLLYSIAGQQAGERFGHAISLLGDVDLDGTAELAVGAPMAGGAAGAEAGRVDVVPMQGAALVQIEGAVAGGQLGTAVSAGHDADGDGRPDMLLGAPLADADTGAQAGMALLYSADGTMLATFVGDGPGHHLGRTVVLSEDLEDDGFADILLGSPLAAAADVTAIFYPAADLDGDGVGENSDNCPGVFNPNQQDSDMDLVGDACDNCPMLAGASQADFDADGHGDACDCATGDALLWEQPALVQGLTASTDIQLPGIVNLQWISIAPQAGTSTVYDLAAGTIGQQGLTNAACVTENLPNTAFPIQEAPPAPGEVRWYLVRGQNGCGVGSYDSGSVSQIVPRDPVVEAGSCSACDHAICQTGGPLSVSCDTCVAQICAVDSYCCDTLWDGICVGEVSSVCGQSCTP